MITTAPTLVFYNPERLTVVSADASSYELGAVSLQQCMNDPDDLKPVAFAPRIMNYADTHYAQIGKKCLAAVRHVKSSQITLLGWTPLPY